MDCGAVCLRMIARFYGRFYSLEYLRDITYFDRDGVSMSNISDAAEQIGFHTLGAKVSFEQLRKDLPLPAIVHWKQEHFVVLYRISDRYAWIADPAVGKVKLSHADFLQAWSSDVEDGEKLGVVLLLETTPEFFEREEEKKQRNSFTYLFEYFRSQKSLVLQVVLGLIVASFIQLAFPFIIESLVDKGINNEDINFIFLVLIAQFALYFFQTAVEFIRSWILLHLGVRANVKLVSDYLMKLMRLPIRFFDSRMTGDLLQRIYDNERVERFLSSSSLSTFFALFNFLIFGFVLAYYDMTIFWVFLVATVLYSVWIVLFLNKRRELDYKKFEQAADSQSALIQLMNGMQEIKLHNAERSKRWSWESVQAKLFRVSSAYLKIDQRQISGAKFINETKNIIITVLAALGVVNGQLSLGQMLAIQYIIGQLNSPIDQLVEFIRAGQDAKISLDRMNEVHNRMEENQSGKITILPETRDIRLEAVHFQYRGPNSVMVLKNIDLVIPEGKTTAIVGTSGSGKTTLLKLLLNFYAPIKGKITVGDLSLQNISDTLWRSKCGVVMQDGYIFSDTIAKNIALGDELIDKKKLLKAVKIARIQSIIDGLPLGYNTKIGPDGIRLSKGQAQRILIARAVYKDPEFIFFDEATNALDAYNEMIIMDNLEEFFYGKTVVIIAHRLSTVKNADNIVVLERGEVVEQGNHENLTAMRGAYYYLVRNQLELGA